MGIFSKEPVIYEKYLKGYKRAENSPAMKKYLTDPDIAKALDEPRERQEFYNKLKEYEEGGITKGEEQEVLGFFRSGKGKYVSGDEAYRAARKRYSSSSDRYRYSLSDKPQTNVPVKSYLGRNGRNSQTVGDKSSIPSVSSTRPAAASAVNRSIPGSTSSNANSPNKSPSSFSRALRSTMTKK